MLAGGGQTAADHTEHSHPTFPAETARHLLLHLDHAQVPLRLVVVEWHAQIIRESQHLAQRCPSSENQMSSRNRWALQRVWMQSSDKCIVCSSEVMDEVAAVAGQHSGDAIHCRGDFLRTPCQGAHHAIATGAVPEKILANIRSALTGQELTDIEITHHALHAVPVLNRGVQSLPPTRIKGGLDYRTQGFGSATQHLMVIPTQEMD